MLTVRHLDSERGADEGEEGGGEVDSVVVVQGHVHLDESLVGQFVGTLPAEAHGGRQGSQHLVHVRVVYVATPTGVIVRPHPQELVQVMSPQDGLVSRQVVKVVHDDSHKQVQHLSINLPITTTTYHQWTGL